MLEKEPSRTAYAAAAYRAAHQVFERGRVFSDPLALPILALTAEMITSRGDDGASTRGMRIFIAARSRFAEDALGAGVETRGVEQLVVLGAGLDTFAYRNPLGSRLRVFEVDHPATQAWKRHRLHDAGIAIPVDLAFTPVNFERDILLERLKASGFTPEKRSFFMWLGVVPYLTREAVISTLTSVGRLQGGAEIVFDYSDPPHSLSPEMRARHDERAARVASIGEPFLSYFDPAELHGKLRELGFTALDDLGPRAIIERIVQPGSSDPALLARLPEQGGHVILAATS